MHETETGFIALKRAVRVTQARASARLPHQSLLHPLEAGWIVGFFDHVLEDSVASTFRLWILFGCMSTPFRRDRCLLGRFRML
jgi:hypothetical protein